MGCKDIRNRKSEFVEKIQLLSRYFELNYCVIITKLIKTSSSYLYYRSLNIWRKTTLLDLKEILKIKMMDEIWRENSRMRWLKMYKKYLFSGLS